jgi:hypothetical protein
LRLSGDPGLFHILLSTSQKLASQSAALCTTSHSKVYCCVPVICTITPLQRGQLRFYSRCCRYLAENLLCYKTVANASEPHALILPPPTSSECEHREKIYAPTYSNKLTNCTP